MEYIEPVFTVLQTKEFIQKYGIEKKMIFAVEEKSLGKVIGHIIFHKFNEPLEYELGWILIENSIEMDMQGNRVWHYLNMVLINYILKVLQLKQFGIIKNQLQQLHL